MNIYFPQPQNATLRISGSTLDSNGVQSRLISISNLTNAFRELAHTPGTAPCCDHIRKGYRRLNVVRHMIYFRVTDFGITIIRILHDRMDAPRHL